MIINDPALLTKITEWRHKCADGSITLDEMREAVKVLRANRVSAAEAAAKSKSGGAKSKKSSTPVDAGSLLDQLNGL
jgi:hypothetical protein